MLGLLVRQGDEWGHTFDDLGVDEHGVYCRFGLEWRWYAEKERLGNSERNWVREIRRLESRLVERVARRKVGAAALRSALGLEARLAWNVCRELAVFRAVLVLKGAGEWILLSHPSREALRRAQAALSCRKLPDFVVDSLEQLLDRPRHCPKRHALEVLQTPSKYYTCDVCNPGQDQARALAPGSTMHGCRLCDWDMCSECAGEN